MDKVYTVYNSFRRLKMTDFYHDMQDVATELLGGELGQDNIVYIATTAGTGDPFNPTPGTTTPYTLKAAANGVEFKYVREGYISASDIQVISAVFDVVPTDQGVMQINGNEKQIISIQQIPAAGTVVAWRIFCKS
jgi:hypothetical protein